MSGAVRAAVVAERGAPVQLEEITLHGPAAGEVRVRVVATGVCHSDLSLARGSLTQQMPTVLGHEATGRVVELGDGVSTLAVGDAVLLNWAPACRACWWCTHGEPFLCEHAGDRSRTAYAQRASGEALYPGLSVGGFATETVIAASSCIPVPAGVPLDQAALLGCAVLTGVGAVTNAASVQPGESVCVIGLGGVGLSAVQGARIAGAASIIAVDASAEKLALAERLGATHALPAGDDLAKRVRALTDGRGVDHAIECVGSAATIRTAWSVSRRGGNAVVVGLGAKTDDVTFNALEITHFARTLRGSMFGNADPERDIPRLFEHVAAGRLDLASLVTRRVRLEELEDAFADMSQGIGARTLVVFGDEP